MFACLLIRQWGFMLTKLVGLNVIVFTIQNKLKKPYDFVFIFLFGKFYEKQEIATNERKIAKNSEKPEKGLHGRKTDKASFTLTIAGYFLNPIFVPVLM